MLFRSCRMKMTDQEHPFTPPPALVQEWIKECDKPNNPRWQEYEQDIATRAAQWGADQELDACCEWVSENDWSPLQRDVEALRAARRPKRPSLAEEALVGLEMIDACAIDQMRHLTVFDELRMHKYTIRRALERLQQLEDQQ